MEERRIHQVFQASILLKGAHALIECVGGLALALIGTDTIRKLVNAFTQEELVLDDKFISLNLDHFNTSLLLMLSYYYPGQFIFIDNEVKDLVDEYVNGKE